MTTKTRLTNRHGLPATIVAAIENDTYDPGASDITVTSLVNSPRIVALTRQHRDEITEDVGDHLYRLFGSGMHAVLERAGEANAITEERLYADVGGWRISGSFDSLTMADDSDGFNEFDQYSLTDWKMTSVYAVKDGVKPEWEAQLNCYAWLLNQHGFPVSSAYIGAMLRDWSKAQAKRNRDWPEIGWKTLPVRLWPEAGQRAYLEERVALHQAARQALPQCSAEERWAKPNTWALMKGTNKRATAVFASEDGAFDSAAAQATPRDYRVEFRPGVSTRCDGYCAVIDFCDQGQALAKAKGEVDAGS